MASEEANRDPGSYRPGSPIAATSILLCIYIAMFLTVGWIVRVLPSAATTVGLGSCPFH